MRTNRIVLLCSILVLIISCNKTETLKNSIPNISKEAIGTKSFVFTDSLRIDPTYGDYRIINLRVWFPTALKKDKENLLKTEYYYAFKDVKKELRHWTSGDIEFMEALKTNSIENATILKPKAPYPIIFLSPSLGGNLSLYSFYAEALVKEGYVVVGVNHLYESEYVIDNKKTYYPTNQVFHDSLKTLKIPEDISADEYRAAKDVRQRVLGEDLIFCLNTLEKLNSKDFSNSIDFEKIGVFGHSMGGTAAIYASYLDNRFKAVINIDGTPPSIILNTGINKPFLFIEDLTDYKNHKGYGKMHKRRNDFCEANREESYRILIGNTNHNSFLDINFHTAENEIEKIKALSVLNKTSFYINSFFNHHLKGENLSFKVEQQDALEIIKFN